jgi:hypothetical protein
MKTKISLNIIVLVIILNSCTEKEEYISYPEKGRYGINILNEIDTVFEKGHYSAAAIIPSGDFIILKSEDKTGDKIGFGGGFGWIYVHDWDNEQNSHFETWKDGEVDMSAHFFNTTSIEIYENGATEPTRIKKIYLKE